MAQWLQTVGHTAMTVAPIRGTTRKSRRMHWRRARHGSREAFADRRVLQLIRVSCTWNEMTGDSPRYPTSVRASVQATHLRSRSRSMCAVNRRPRGRGRPRCTRDA